MHISINSIFLIYRQPHSVKSLFFNYKREPRWNTQQQFTIFWIQYKLSSHVFFSPIELIFRHRRCCPPTTYDLNSLTAYNRRCQLGTCLVQNTKNECSSIAVQWSVNSFLRQNRRRLPIVSFHAGEIFA